MTAARRLDHGELHARLTENIERLADALLVGVFNRTQSTKQTLRFGTNGKIAIELHNSGAKKRGDCYDHSAGQGGGPLWLIQHVLGCSRARAVEWGWSFLGGSTTPWTPRPKAEPETPSKKNAGRYHLKLAAECVAVHGTLAERYLREHRRIEGPLSSQARFHPSVWHTESKRAWPALVFVAADASGVRRVQAVFLDPAIGAKAPIAPVKKTFGVDASDVPAVLAARHEGGPIRLVEGPEDAATIWSLTGDTVMCTMGSSNLHKPKIPAGAHVVVCGDATDEGRAAARKAAQRYVAAGCRVETAFAKGAKDFNEALQLFGRDRTLEMLRGGTAFRAHGLPPYYLGPTEPRDAALARQNAAIRTAVSDGMTRGFAHREIERRYALETVDPEMTPAEKGAMRRRIKRDVEAECGHIPDRRTVLVTGSQGTGKTQTALQALAKIAAPAWASGDLVVHAYELVLKKAYELASDYLDVASADSLPVKVVLGRGAPDPERGDRTPMCPRHEVVNRAAARGIMVRSAICPTCPLRETCGSMRQEREIAAMSIRGLFIHAHSYLAHHSPAPAPDFVIVDEGAVLGLINDPLECSPDSLRDVVPFSGADLGNTVAANLVINRVVEALKSPQALAAVREAGVTDADLQHAAKVIAAAIDDAKPQIDGEMSDDAIDGVLDGWQAGNLGAALAVLRAVRRELRQPRNNFIGITFDPARRVRVDGRDERLPRLRVHRRRETNNIPVGASVLLLDGSGDPRLNRVVFGDLDHVHTPVERDAFVIGTALKSYSRQSLTGLDRRGAPLPHRAKEAAQLRADVKIIVGNLSAMCDGQGGVVIASKRVAEMFQTEDVLPDRGDVAHFGALRGLNTWEDQAFALSVGRESVSLERLEDMTRALFADDPEPFTSFAVHVPNDWPWQHWPYRATRGRRMRDGSVQAVEVEVHPDPRAQAVLEQLREAEIIQGVDRTRPIFNHRVLALLNDLVIDVTYDRVWRHDELVAGGNRFDVAWARSGILPLTARDLHRAHGRLFPSESAAKDALAAVGKTGGVAQIGSFLGFPPSFSFRRKGQRGPAARVLIDTNRHTNPLRALRAALATLRSAGL